jgi:hypothetical protein
MWIWYKQRKRSIFGGEIATPRKLAGMLSVDELFKGRQSFSASNSEGFESMTKSPQKFGMRSLLHEAN